jgi:seryl-tRNA synthetase
MHDIKTLEQKRAALSRRKDFDPKTIDEILSLNAKKLEILHDVEQKKAKQNTISKQIPVKKAAGEDATDMIAESKALGDEISLEDDKVRELDEKIEYILLRMPNAPHESVPDGDSDADNVEIKKVGEIPKFDFEPLPHWEIGEKLGIIDPQTAAKTTGSRFTFYRDFGARLERAIVNFFLDHHTQKNNYGEIFPPFMVSRQSMTGVGQLPKFEDDAYKVVDTDYFLIPTAEVPVTNMYRDCILSEDELPIKHAAYSACFRKEAGSASRDTRGLIRQHQFNKVELVKFVKPEESYRELDLLLADAESVLRELEIPYRVVAICLGDLGFQAAKKYDIEVWMPSYNRYVEISSCSNFEDFQARRINIKYRDKATKKARFVHTINGSGVAVGRTVAAILENFQTKDGSPILPKALAPYFREV